MFRKYWLDPMVGRKPKCVSGNMKLKDSEEFFLTYKVLLNPLDKKRTNASLNWGRNRIIFVFQVSQGVIYRVPQNNACLSVVGRVIIWV